MSKAENEFRNPLGENPALPAPHNRDQLWTTAALEGELEKLTNLDEDMNINKPGSPFFASLVKIAAIMKGTGASYLTTEETVAAIKAACSNHTWFREKEVQRQWKNAQKYAKPRYRRD